MGKHGFKLLTLLLAIILLGSIAYIQRDNWLPGAKIPPSDRPAPDFALTDLQGNTVSLETTAGKARLVYFYFASCPDICQPSTFILSKVQEYLLDKGVDNAMLMSVTIDPETDTTERLTEYSARFGADPEKWRFLRSDDEQSVWDLALQYGISVVKVGPADFIHGNIFFLIDKEGMLRKMVRAGVEEVELMDYEIIGRDLMRLARE